MTFIVATILTLSLGTPKTWADDTPFQLPTYQAHIALDGSKQPPADDLICDPKIWKACSGQILDRDAAMALRSKGADLSLFDPLRSDIWSAQSLSTSDVEPEYFPSGGPAQNEAGQITFNFVDTFPEDISGFLRTRVLGTVPGPSGETITRTYQLTFTFMHHQALARAALLRRLGYPLHQPQYYRRIKLQFENEAARDQFLDVTLMDQIEPDYDRGQIVVERPVGQSYALMKDVILERLESSPPNGLPPMPALHWGFVPANILQQNLAGRRSVRALLITNGLLDFDEVINATSWEGAEIDQGSAVVHHIYADAFEGITSVDDARWILRKIGMLSRSDWKEILDQTHYPGDIRALMLEKTIARRNHFLAVFGLLEKLGPLAALRYDSKISIGKVKKGILQKSSYPDYSSTYFLSLRNSPVSVGEMFRYFGLAAVNKGLQLLVQQGNTAVSLQDPKDIQEKYFKQLQKNAWKFPRNGDTILYPLNVYGGLTAAPGISVSRNVYSGSYYGVDTEAQLVDNISVQANVGYFAGVDLGPDLNAKIQPGASANITIQRNYVHVHPVDSMKDAAGYDPLKLAVPLFMSSLSRLLNSKSDSDEDRDSTWKAFKSKFADGEVFVVTDSVIVGGRIGMSVPLANVLSMNFLGVSPVLSASVGAQTAIIKRTTIVKENGGFQVYVQDIRPKSLDIGIELGWWLKFASLQNSWKHGEATTQAFILDRLADEHRDRQGELDSDFRDRMMGALKAVFKSNNTKPLEKNFAPYDLAHDTHASIKRRKFLWWKSFSLEEAHELKVKPPVSDDNSYDAQAMQRTLYSYRFNKIKGLDKYGFLSDVAEALQKDAGFDGAGGGDDPSSTFFGSSRSTTAQAEIELTPSLPTGVQRAPMVVSLENRWAGWRMSAKKLNRLIDKVNDSVKDLHALPSDLPLVRKEVFANANGVQLFDLSTQLYVNEKGINKLIYDILPFTKKVRDAFWTFITIDGVDDYWKWCKKDGLPLYRDNASRKDALYSYVLKEEGKEVILNCVCPWMRTALDLYQELRDRKFETPQAKAKVGAHVLFTLEGAIQFGKLLEWIGSENYYFQVRLSGFKQGDPNNENPFASDVIGTANRSEIVSPFEQVSNVSGIYSHELFARYLSEGF